MSMNPDSPPTVEVKVASNILANEWQVTALHIDLVPKQIMKTKVFIRWTWGYMDGDTYIAAGQDEETFIGEEGPHGPTLMMKISAQADDTKSIYENIKFATWELLQEIGRVPAGTIT